MKYLSPRLIAPLLALVLSPVAGAMEFRFLAWDEQVAARPLAVLGGADKDGIGIKNLHPLKRSKAVEAKLSEANLLVRVLDKKDDAGKPIDFSVKVTANVIHPLVLLLPDPKAASGLRGYMLEDDVANFPWGTYRMLNGTGKELAMRLGSLVKPLAAGWTPLDLMPGGNKPLPVEIAMRDTAEPNSMKTVYSAVWKPDPDVRNLVFIVPGTEPRLGPLSIKVIPENRKTLQLEAEADGAAAGGAAGAGSGASSRSAEHRTAEEP